MQTGTISIPGVTAGNYRLDTVMLPTPYPDTNYNAYLSHPTTWSGVAVHTKSTDRFTIARQCINNDSSTLQVQWATWTD